jgi:hypothetical protein
MLPTSLIHVFTLHVVPDFLIMMLSFCSERRTQSCAISTVIYFLSYMYFHKQNRMVRYIEMVSHFFVMGIVHLFIDIFLKFYIGNIIIIIVSIKTGSYFYHYVANIVNTLVILPLDVSCAQWNPGCFEILLF